MRNAVGSAIDVMQAIGTSIYTLLSKVADFVFLLYPSFIMLASCMHVREFQSLADVK